MFYCSYFDMTCFFMCRMRLSCWRLRMTDWSPVVTPHRLQHLLKQPVHLQKPPARPPRPHANLWGCRWTTSTSQTPLCQVRSLFHNLNVELFGSNNVYFQYAPSKCCLAIVTLFLGIVKSLWIFFRCKYIIEVARMTIWWLFYINLIAVLNSVQYNNIYSGLFL